MRKPLGSARLGLLLTTLAASWAAGQSTTSTEPTTADLQARIKALEERLAQLESRQVTQGDLDATRQRLLEDAERRSKLASAVPMTGGWDPAKQQFFLASENRDFYFHPGVLLQFRNVTNYRQNVTVSGDDDLQNGFEIRRAKFGFDGNVFGPDLSYRFQWQDSVNGGAPTLEYGYLQYLLMHDIGANHADVAIRAGQFKDIVFKEEFIGDPMQLMVERSLANALIGGVALGPLVQGVDFMYVGKGNPLHAEFLFHDGAGSGNTDFRDGPDNFGVAGRIDYKAYGDWADTADLTGKNSGKRDLLDIGAGIDFTDADNSAATRGTIDMQYLLHQRLALLAALYLDYTDFRNVATSDRFDRGAMAEAGYFLTPALQAVARYTYVRLDSSAAVNGTHTYHEISAGLNYFMGDNGAAGNHAKLTFDVTYLPHGSPDLPGLDYLASSGDNQFVLRMQWQLWL